MLLMRNLQKKLMDMLNKVLKSLFYAYNLLSNDSHVYILIFKNGPSLKHFRYKRRY